MAPKKTRAAKASAAPKKTGTAKKAGVGKKGAGGGGGMYVAVIPAPAPPAGPAGAPAPAPVAPAPAPASPRANAAFWRSQFMKTENYPTVAPQADLNNSIHPLFEKRNFKSVNVNWNIIRTPARLATKFLRAEAIQPMFHTILSHHPVLQAGLRTNEDKAIWRYVGPDDQPARKLTRLQTANIDTALAALARMIRFVRDNSVNEGGVTDPDDRMPTDTYFPHGVGSTIRYAGGTYQKMVDARTRGDWPLLRILQFEFAIMLVHEVCHALFNAREGDVPWEPFFKNSKVAEVGFEMECRLFGGHIQNLWRDADAVYKPAAPAGGAGAGGGAVPTELGGVMVKWMWPYRELIEKYKRAGDLIATRGVMPDMDLAWRIRLPYFTEKFTNDFWDDEDSEDIGGSGLTKLHPEREVGYFFIENRPRKPTVALERRMNEQGYKIIQGKKYGNTVIEQSRGE